MQFTLHKSPSLVSLTSSMAPSMAWLLMMISINGLSSKTLNNMLTCIPTQPQLRHILLSLAQELVTQTTQPAMILIGTCGSRLPVLSQLPQQPTLMSSHLEFSKQLALMSQSHSLTTRERRRCPHLHQFCKLHSPQFLAYPCFSSESFNKKVILIINVYL